MIVNRINTLFNYINYLKNITALAEPELVL